jgi:hypothetical protein
MYGILCKCIDSVAIGSSNIFADMTKYNSIEYIYTRFNISEHIDVRACQLGLLHFDSIMFSVESVSDNHKKDRVIDQRQKQVIFNEQKSFSRRFETEAT